MEDCSRRLDHSSSAVWISFLFLAECNLPVRQLVSAAETVDMHAVKYRGAYPVSVMHISLYVILCWTGNHILEAYTD